MPPDRPRARTPPAFEQGRDYVQSLARGMAVLQGCAEGTNPLALPAIAERAGVSRAAARRLVLTLEHLGYLRRIGEGYAPTSRVLELGYGFLGAQNLGELAQPAMEALSHEVGESCSMAVLDDQHIIYVARVPVRRVMTVSLAVGARLPAWCTSMGRALLSGMEPADLKAWLARCQPRRLTPRTVTDRRELARRIAAVRKAGHAWVEQELEPGLCSLAVPVHGRDGQVVAALNIGLSYHAGARADALQRLLPPLKKTARRIERGLPRGWLAPVSA